MKENFAYFARLTAYFVGNLLKVYTLTLVSIVLAVSLFFSSISSNMPALNFANKVIFLFTDKAYLSIPFILIIIGSIYVLYTKSFAYAISKTINKLLQEKSESAIAPYLIQAIDFVADRNTDLFQSIDSFTSSKSTIINSIQSAESNRMTKIILKYILQKINLDDVAFNSENTPFKTILQSKIMSKLHEIAQPDGRIFWLVIGLQWLFVFIAYYFK